jgi:succinate-semialdehyde dehydrogenase/glutarate-semialdehyde dehydrogenase
MTGKIDTQAWINNTWMQRPDSATFPVTDPATGVALAEVTSCSPDMVEQAIQAAHTAFPYWAALLPAERCAILLKYATLIEAQLDRLAELLTREQGKPLKESKVEIKGAIDQLRWNAEEARRLRGDTLPPFKAGTAITVSHQPIGVVAAICPWNFPVGMVLRKIGPALAVGCTVVLKPAPETPLSALALARLAGEAGLPPGVLNIVPVSAKETPPVGTLLTTHELIRKVSFTGSTEIGKILMAQAADGIKKLSLELGGNAPFIVFASADLDAAADGMIASKFRNAGQTCICTNRAFVEKSVAPAFIEKLTARVQKLKVGNGLQSDTEIGPVINQDALKKIKAHLADALEKGGKLVCEGSVPDGGKQFIAPCIIEGLSADMLIFNEETFGPVLAVSTFDSESDVINLANSTPYGLAAYFYSTDLAQCHRIAAALEYGMVGVNEPLLADASVPFGGVKQSGFGREGSWQGLREFTVEKYVLWGGLTVS